MEEAKIKAWGYAVNRFLLGVAAVISAFQAPDAISSYAASVKVESIVSNTLSSVQKIINTNNNSNTNNFNFFKEQAGLLKALPSSSKFITEVKRLPQASLTGLGLKIPKDDFQKILENAKTKKDYKDAIQNNFPTLLYFDDIKVNIDEVKDFDKGK